MTIEKLSGIDEQVYLDCWRPAVRINTSGAADCPSS
jgi:hypothetical protein